ncbi:hypothetical protein FKW77_002603 [Venturia effusa]|uniref:Uncharacterized protein n=1 Tax=Venturia effusa TaxID=50376 RepID=A0A517LMD9_9PEZI|nr:hypothetical protein FKW77_002603 [Venturia effusa]
MAASQSAFDLFANRLQNTVSRELVQLRLEIQKQDSSSKVEDRIAKLVQRLDKQDDEIKMLEQQAKDAENRVEAYIAREVNAWKKAESVFSIIRPMRDVANNKEIPGFPQGTIADVETAVERMAEIEVERLLSALSDDYGIAKAHGLNKKVFLRMQMGILP